MEEITNSKRTPKYPKNSWSYLFPKYEGWECWSENHHTPQCNVEDHHIHHIHILDIYCPMDCAETENVDRKNYCHYYLESDFIKESAPKVSRKPIARWTNEPNKIQKAILIFFLVRIYPVVGVHQDVATAPKDNDDNIDPKNFGKYCLTSTQTVPSLIFMFLDQCLWYNCSLHFYLYMIKFLQRFQKKASNRSHQEIKKWEPSNAVRNSLGNLNQSWINKKRFYWG